MKEAFEKIKERLRDKMNHSFNQRYKAFVESIEIVNQVAEEYKDKYVSLGAYQQCAWERDIAIEQLHDLGYEFGQKIDSNDVIVSNLAKAYAVNIKRYGVDITGKLETATQNAAALNQAYLRGRQDERDKFDKWREEYGKDTNVSSNDGWIPCSEKTPEFEIYEIKKMWVTMHRKGCDFYFTRQLRWNGSQGIWEWDNGKAISDEYEIIAWKLLNIPKPYQPKGEK